MLRQHVINAIIKAIGAHAYLQIGSARGMDEIDCAVKRSVFIEHVNDLPIEPRPDVVYVDPPMDAGRANFAMQVAHERVSRSGVVVVGNVGPTEAWQQEVPPSSGVQLGQAWRAWLKFRQTCGHRSLTIDTDHGVGIVIMSEPAEVGADPLIDFQTFLDDRARWLGLVSVSDGLAAFEAPAEPEPVPEPAPVSEPSPEPAKPPRKRRSRKAGA